MGRASPSPSNGPANRSDSPSSISPDSAPPFRRWASGRVEKLKAAGFVLGVLSDSEAPAAQLQQRFIKLGLAGCFSTVVSSVELGRTKPDPRCYQRALDAMNLPPQRVAFVGHDAEELHGAAAVGMPTIAFNYEPGAEADVFIERFDDLVKAVGATPCYAAAG